ncbi:kelch-like protein 41b [Drosophila biarmipes]|uniref:kelch-like protein 41b n=1 Tax=Drosophila biarmipes TaxID=125945 RepID=UPI0007E5FA20|nr:kelch-like protein 41b [Drosophila biarmipes]XP_043950865.1 kelch-like protein 41b [Drosophila biarmipes]
MEKWLQPVFSNLLENKKFSDCRILVGKKSFDSHKVILSSASEFFERMFLSDFQESKSGEFRLTEVEPETFAEFLAYVYTYNKENLAKKPILLIMDLLRCGSTWLVTSLVSDCVEILSDKAPSMVITELVELFQYAHNLNNKILIRTSTLNLKNRFGATMNCYDALLLTSDAFEQYIIITGGVLAEIERFKMIQSYMTVNGLINQEDDESSPVVVDEKNDGSDSVDGDLVIPKPTFQDSEDKEDKDDEADGETDLVPKDNDVDSKIKLIHRKYIKRLLGYIKFDQMTKNEFYRTIGKSTLLNYKEKYEKLYLTK